MRRLRQRDRRGATVLEMALWLGLFLLITLGMLDLGLGVFRYHIVSQAARLGARRAIVHGELATALGVWGPTAINTTGDDQSTPIMIDSPEDPPLAVGLGDLLVTCDRENTTVDVEWPSGSNAFGEPVRVTVTTPHTPVFAWIFPGGTINLTASSTMAIAH